MGQFDLETDAALTQINFEELSTTPGGEFAEMIGELLKLVGGSGPLGIAGGVSNLMLKVRKLAGSSYENNLVYTITAVRNDLATLYVRYENLRERIGSLGADLEFAEAISALALQAMHTSVKGRLVRLARIVVNGVKDSDLEPESLDDMMRAAVELKEGDLILLGRLYKSQNRPFPVEAGTGNAPNGWHGGIRALWREFVDSEALNAEEHLSNRSSFSRLESAGLIQRVTEAGMDSVGLGIYALLPEGKKFYERLQEIAG